MTVSVPRVLFRAVETERRVRRRPRSEIVNEAIATWIRERDMARKVRQYVEGHRRYPVTEEEGRDARAWEAAEAWSGERWR